MMRCTRLLRNIGLGFCEMRLLSCNVLNDAQSLGLCGLPSTSASRHGLHFAMRSGRFPPQREQSTELPWPA